MVQGVKLNIVSQSGSGNKTIGQDKLVAQGIFCHNIQKNITGFVINAYYRKVFEVFLNLAEFSALCNSAPFCKKESTVQIKIRKEQNFFYI
jgi:hypothetical protein